MIRIANGCWCGGTYTRDECPLTDTSGNSLPDPYPRYCSYSPCSTDWTSYEMLYPYTIVPIDTAAGYCSDSYTANEYMSHERASKEMCASWCHRNLDTNPWAIISYTREQIVTVVTPNQKTSVRRGPPVHLTIPTVLNHSAQLTRVHTTVHSVVCQMKPATPLQRRCPCRTV